MKWLKNIFGRKPKQTEVKTVREVRKSNTKSRYQRLKAQGLCVKCGSKVRKPRNKPKPVMCKTCRIAWNKWQNARKNK